MIHQHSTRRFRVGFMLTWKVKICSIVSFKAQFTRFWVLVLQVLKFPRKFQGWNLSNTTYLQKTCEKTSETLRTCKFLKWSTWLSMWYLQKSIKCPFSSIAVVNMCHAVSSPAYDSTPFDPKTFISMCFVDSKYDLAGSRHLEDRPT